MVSWIREDRKAHAYEGGKEGGVLSSCLAPMCEILHCVQDDKPYCVPECGSVRIRLLARVNLMVKNRGLFFLNKVSGLRK